VSIPTTAPLRLISDINQCIKKAIKNKSDVVLVSSKAKRNPYFNMVKYKKNNKISLVCEKNDNKFYRRQDAPKCFDLTTVCYVFKPNYILNSYDLFSGNTNMIVIPNSRALDMDDLFDYKISKLLLNDKK
jgi:N-acylneuraminate cytidylyltransferase